MYIAEIRPCPYIPTLEYSAHCASVARRQLARSILVPTPVLHPLRTPFPLHLYLCSYIRGPSVCGHFACRTQVSLFSLLSRLFPVFTVCSPLLPSRRSHSFPLALARCCTFHTFISATLSPTKWVSSGILPTGNPPALSSTEHAANLGRDIRACNARLVPRADRRHRDARRPSGVFDLRRGSVSLSGRAASYNTRRPFSALCCRLKRSRWISPK